MTFVDWDDRPAVLFDVARGEAMAVLSPGGAWDPVDALDVFATGRVLPSFGAMAARFESTFGSLSPPDRFTHD